MTDGRRVWHWCYSSGKGFSRFMQKILSRTLYNVNIKTEPLKGSRGPFFLISEGGDMKETLISHMNKNVNVKQY